MKDGNAILDRSSSIWKKERREIREKRKVGGEEEVIMEGWKGKTEAKEEKRLEMR